MNKPLISIDLEATGANTAKDRIVQIGLDDGSAVSTFYCNPGFDMSDEVIAIHGITNERLKDEPPFAAIAQAIYNYVKDADLLGFNLTNFDVPMLWEEFYRCGIVWDLSNTKILDAGTLFKRREERTLSAAVQFYLNRSHNEAHCAAADAMATREVWNAQVARYGLTHVDRELLQKESNYEEIRVDLAGKLIFGKDGRPVYNFGNSRGVAVVDDPGFGFWMLNRDFSENTKIHLRKILKIEEPAETQELLF